MSRAKALLGCISATALAVTFTAPGTTAATAPASSSTGTSGVTAAQALSLKHGVQIARKGSLGTANPYLAMLPDTARVDWAGWNTKVNATGAARVAKVKASASLQAAQAANEVAGTPAGVAAGTLVHDEQEPNGTNGSNDSLANAERIYGFGTKAGQQNHLRILGSGADLRTTPVSRTAKPEDNGSIPLSQDLGIQGTRTAQVSAVLGDGPHGSDGSGSGDFDFYTVEAAAGANIYAETTSEDSSLDTVLAVYNASGELVAANDDFMAGSYLSRINYTAPSAGTYYVMVGGFGWFGAFPADPFDSGSGPGAGSEGDYSITAGISEVDTDVYGLSLQKGDVLGATISGAANGLRVLRPDGKEMVGSSGLDASALYPEESPLPAGGSSTLAYVAEQTGWYGLQVDPEYGGYDALVEVYRPGAENDTTGVTQTVFLDFDGQRVNTGIWGGPGVRQLSPFSAFIAKWGLNRADEADLIARITDNVRENLQRDLAARSSNPNIKLRVLNSRTSPDVFGQPHVSRVVVGGTIAQSGISTIGIAQSIDPGNFGREESSLVLLDVLSDPANPSNGRVNDPSINGYLRPWSDRKAFVSQAIGNVVSHEIGHTIGNYHTDNMSPAAGLMDSGGANFGRLFGAGRDLVGGTSDDKDVDFITDIYSTREGFTGVENTLNVSAWAFAPRR